MHGKNVNARKITRNLKYHTYAKKNIVMHFPCYYICLRNTKLKRIKGNISQINGNFLSKFFLWPAITSEFHMHRKLFLRDHPFKNSTFFLLKMQCFRLWKEFSLKKMERKHCIETIKYFFEYFVIHFFIRNVIPNNGNEKQLQWFINLFILYTSIHIYFWWINVWYETMIIFFILIVQSWK